MDLRNLSAVDTLEKLQYHKSDLVYENVSKILQSFFEIQDPLDLWPWSLHIVGLIGNITKQEAIITLLSSFRPILSSFDAIPAPSLKRKRILALTSRTSFQRHFSAEERTLLEPRSYLLELFGPRPTLWTPGVVGLELMELFQSSCPTKQT